jgi:septal ring factor EnvC (AmiA/AmiB activator)
LSMKKQNLESVTQQLNFDLDQAREEIREERMQRDEIEKSLFNLEKELNQALGDLEYTQKII